MKNKKFWMQRIQYYNVIPLAGSGIFLLLFHNTIIEIVCGLNNVSPFDPLYELIQNMVNIILLAVWSYFAFTHTRNQYYHLKTGRRYPADRHQFNKTFFSLLEFFSKNDKYIMDPLKLPEEDWHTADGVILGKTKDIFGNYRLVKRESGAPGNLVTFGLPGSGKSTTQAASSALRFNANLVEGGCGVFAISIKGDLLNFAKHGNRTNIKVFTPDKAEGSCHYDPLGGVAQMNWTDRRIWAENLAIIISPDERGDNAQYFVKGSRNYFIGTVLYLLHLHDTGKRSGELKFPEIVDTILNNDVFQLTMDIHDCGNTIPGEYTNGYIGSNEKNVAGLWSHLCEHVRSFNSGAIRELFDGEGDCISPDDLSTGDIYIDVPQDKFDIYAPCMSIIVSNFLQAFMRRPDVSSGEAVVPVLFLLDEAVQLNLDFSVLSKAMSTLRSKKVSLFLLMQSIAQLEGRYGEAEAREIMDLCAYISVFNAQDTKSREYFSKMVGKRKMLKRSTSLSKADNNQTNSVSVTEVEEDIIAPADLGDLSIKKDGITIPRVLVYANGHYVIGETTPCYE